ncbi:SPOSA6832_00149, partial [Sporobolomyces salmonicolor]
MSATRVVDLVRFEPDNDAHVAELKHQRIRRIQLCGWGVESVEIWREQVRRGVKGLFWIFPTEGKHAEGHFRPLPEREALNADTDKLGPSSPDPSFRPMGHVSLVSSSKVFLFAPSCSYPAFGKDWEDYQHDDSLANRDEGVCTLASFYILASQQGLGLGTVVMKELEALAVKLGARAITLNTVDGEEAVKPEFWEKQGIRYSPKLRVNEVWYKRLGYVVYKRGVPRYPAKDVNGNDYLLEAVVSLSIFSRWFAVVSGEAKQLTLLFSVFLQVYA